MYQVCKVDTWKLFIVVNFFKWNWCFFTKS